MSTLTDVQKALEDSQVLQQHWINGGWNALSDIMEEELMKSKVLDVYPYVEIDVSVNITIVLPDRIYRVPLEDVSDIHVNNCLVIGHEDLYIDWEERVWKNINEEQLIYSGLEKRDKEFSVRKFLGADGKVRTVKQVIN
jgi:hypothetical protein